MAHQPGTPVRLETERFVLRSMTPADVTPAFASWFSDPKVNEHLFLPPQAKAGRAEDFARQMLAGADNKTRFLLGVFLKQTGVQIGYVRFVVDPRNRHVIPTTVIGDREWWLRRVPGELFTALTPFFFDELGLNKIVITAYSENDLVARILKFVGYVQEGYFREHEWTGERFRDVVQFGRLASEWRSSGQPY